MYGNLVYFAMIFEVACLIVNVLSLETFALLTVVYKNRSYLIMFYTITKFTEK